MKKRKMKEIKAINKIFTISVIALVAILFGISVYIGVGLWNKHFSQGEPIIPVGSITIDKVSEEVIEEFPKKTYVKEDEDTGVMSYGSPTMKIIIEPVIKDNLTMWVSTIKIKDPKQLESAFARDEFNLTNREKTSDMARRQGAIFAVNGSAAGFNENSFVIRDGIVYRATDMDFSPLSILENGDLRIYGRKSKTGDELIELGVRHTYDFGPDLIRDGEIIRWGADWYSEGKDPRTAIGQKGPLEYIVIVVDGRSKKSEGITFQDLAIEFEKLDCQWAYVLDGGGSTTLYFNGQVINNPSDWNGERAVTDILYFRD